MIRYYLIIIWRRPDNTLYYKKILGFYKKYFVGYINGNNHEVVLIIDLFDLYYTLKKPLRNKIIEKVIDFLQKLKK